MHFPFLLGGWLTWQHRRILLPTSEFCLLTIIISFSHVLDLAGTSLTAIVKVFFTESIRTSISRHPWSCGHLVMQPFLFLYPAAKLYNSQRQREQWQPNAHFHWTSSCFSASTEARHRTGNSLQLYVTIISLQIHFSSVKWKAFYLLNKLKEEVALCERLIETMSQRGFAIIK